MDWEIVGIVAALSSSASWAVGSILFKRLGERISAMAMTLAKGTVSVVLLAAAVAVTGYQGVDQHSLLLLAISGVLGIAFGDTFFFEALQDLGPHALVVLLLLGQVITVGLAVVYLGETPTLSEWFGIILVVFGIGIVLFAKLSGEQRQSGIRGVAFGVLSVLCMSVSIIVAKQGLANISTIQATFIRMLAGTVGILCFGAVQRQLGGWMSPFKDPQLVGRFVGSVCLVTFGGFWLSLVAVKYLDVAIASTLDSTEPLFILPLAAIVLKERITLQSVGGTAIALLGIVLICFA